MKREKEDMIMDKMIMLVMYILVIISGIKLFVLPNINNPIIKTTNHQSNDYLDYKFNQLENRLKRTKVILDFKKENNDCILYGEVK